MGAAAPKPPLAIPPHSKLRGFLTFSRERSHANKKAQPLEGQTIRADNRREGSRQRVQVKDSQDPHMRDQLRCAAWACG